MRMLRRIPHSAAREQSPLFPSHQRSPTDGALKIDVARMNFITATTASCRT